MPTSPATAFEKPPLVPSPASRLELVVRRVGDVAILNLMGSLTSDETTHLLERVQELADGETKKFVVNLAQVVYMDSSVLEPCSPFISRSRQQGVSASLPALRRRCSARSRGSTCTRFLSCLGTRVLRCPVSRRRSTQTTTPRVHARTCADHLGTDTASVNLQHTRRTTGGFSLSFHSRFRIEHGPPPQIKNRMKRHLI